jgi:diguanylate cyclase (GGDEF)-like protein
MWDGILGESMLPSAREALDRAEIRKLRKENLRQAAKIAELEKLVLRDTLTPLYNRRHFMAVLDRTIARAGRYGGNFAMLFIDVDHLKRVNDGLGHAAGDALLIAVGDALQLCVRKSDIVARIGGDEFAILLENIEPKQVPKKADDTARYISQLQIAFADHIMRPEISIGYAIITGEMTCADVMLQADKSMYSAKLHNQLSAR